jgi:hypothetical protein
LEHKHSGSKKDIPHRSDGETEIEKSIPVRNINLDLQDVEGIGPTSSKKRKKAGINSEMKLAVTNIDQLAVDISLYLKLAKIGHYSDSLGIIKRFLDHYNKEKRKGLR